MALVAATAVAASLLAGCAGRPPAAGVSRPAQLRSTPASSTSTTASAPESYPVGRTTFQFVDGSRTVSIGGRVVARPLGTVVDFPTGRAAAGRTFPLVVFGPGYRQCPLDYASLLDAWAAAGYVVAAVSFPLTGCDVPGGARESDIVNQPADVSFVIGQLIAAAGARGGALSGRIDGSRVAVAGHSDGGDTAVALAAGTCCRDGRVRAAIVLAGAELTSLGGSWFPAGTPPLLLVQGGADTVNPPAASEQMFATDGGGPAFLLRLPGAGHLPPYQGGAAQPLVARVTLDFLDRYLRDAGNAEAALARDGNVAGQAELVSRAT